MNGVDVAVLEKVLNNFDLGIDPRSDVTRISDHYEWTYETNEKDMAFDKQFNTITWGRDDRYYNFLSGIWLYGNLFLISPSDNRNLFRVRESKTTTMLFNPLSHIKKPTKKHKKLINDILRYIYGKAPKKEISFPDSNGFEDYNNYLVQAFDAKLNDPMPLIHKDPQKNGTILTSMNFKEVVEKYFNQVMEEANGKISVAAKIAGLKEDTLRKRLKKINSL